MPLPLVWQGFFFLLLHISIIGNQWNNINETLYPVIQPQYAPSE